MRVIGGLFALGLGLTTAVAQEPIQFEADPPQAFLSFVGDYRWFIYARGTIDANAGARLEQLVREKRIPAASMVVLDSPGGDLLGGMALGQVIRRSGLTTLIGRRPQGSSTVGVGACHSACALAFLGGEYRFWKDGSTFGVHRFSWSRPERANADDTQKVSAAVVAYIRSMDVDTHLFTLASQAGREEMIVPPRQILEQLHVIDNGAKRAVWSIESVPGAVYLKGERETANGTNKFIVGCTQGQPLLISMFTAGHNADRVMQFKADTLLLNEEQVPIEDRRVRRTNQDGLITSVHSLDDALLTRMAAAQTVGIALQATRDEGIFFGFERMPFGDGAAKLQGYLDSCGVRR